jgi:DNA repair protein RadC
MGDKNTVNPGLDPDNVRKKLCSCGSRDDARQSLCGENFERASALQKAQLTPILGTVTGMPLEHVAQVIREQPANIRLDKLIWRLANGEINHALLTYSARIRLGGSIALHSLAAQEPLRQPSQSYNWHSLESFVIAELSALSREVFMAMFLDVQYRLLASEVLFLGSVDSAPVYTRVVASRALAHHAASVVVAHNHPSGALTPSHSDVDVTLRLAKALKLLDIQLLDHLIAGDGRCVSLRNLGFV